MSNASIATKSSSPATATAAASSTKNETNAAPTAATAPLPAAAAGGAPGTSAAPPAAATAAPRGRGSASGAHPAVTHPHPHVHAEHPADVKFHEHAPAGVHAHSAVPSAHLAVDEKNSTQYSATGDHDAHHPSKPAIHPTAPIAATAHAPHSSTEAATAATGATGVNPQGRHHYALKEDLSGSLWTLTTSKSWKLVCEEFPLQVTAHKFSIVGKHDLQDSLTKKGLQFRDEAMIFELCNPQIAANVLAEHLALSAVLPCRISVTAKYGEDGCAIHLFLPNALLSACFPQQEEAVASSQPSKKLYKFQEVAENVTATLKEIAKKAASK